MLIGDNWRDGESF